MLFLLVINKQKQVDDRCNPETIVLSFMLAGTGMSEAELERNPVLTDYTVRDLNSDPTLPYEDNSFDVITNVVSVDYLNKPLVRRVHSL